MQGSGNSIFDSSSVLSERIYSNEQEISKTRSHLEAVTEERDNLREDLRGYRDSKRQSDNGWRAEKQKVQALEKELSFYQTHSTKAFADRDKAVLEAEQLKADSISLQKRLAKAESSAAQNTAICRETQTQLDSAQQRVAELEIKETECQAIPGLRQDLSEATEQIADLTYNLRVARTEGANASKRADEASTSYDSIKLQYSEAQSEAKKAATAAAAEVSSLQGQVSRLQAERDRLDARASTAERDLAAATSELEEARLSLKVKLEEQQNQFRAIEEEQYSEWEKRVLAVQQKEDKLKKTTKDLQAERDQAMQDKLAADGNSSHAAAGGKGVVPSPQKASTWKDTLAARSLSIIGRTSDELYILEHHMAAVVSRGRVSRFYKRCTAASTLQPREDRQADVRGFMDTFLETPAGDFFVLYLVLAGQAGGCQVATQVDCIHPLTGFLPGRAHKDQDCKRVCLYCNRKVCLRKKVLDQDVGTKLL
ncbi:hypothetical protein WJX82_009775 [Trebouxia sp. C0006]